MANGQICRSQANNFLTTIFQNSYIGLATNDTVPDVDGGNITEPSPSAGYARHKLTEMSTPADGQIHNKDIIFMGESLESWGTITHLIVSKSETGSVIFYAPLNAPVVVPAGYVPVFRKNALIVGIDKEFLTVPT